MIYRRARQVAVVSLFVCAGWPSCTTNAASADEPADADTAELPAGTEARVPDAQPILLDARRYLVSEPALTDAIAALRNERRLESELKRCGEDLDSTVNETSGPSPWWTGLKWAGVGAAVVGAFFAGAVVL